jgi:hypothetical protein
MKSKREPKRKKQLQSNNNKLSFLTREWKARSEYGIIYVVVSGIVKALWLLNLVEWFKRLFYHICRLVKKDVSKKTATNWAIDLFIVLKFILVYRVIYLPEKPVYLVIVLYLLIMNIFTYFYYHIWKATSDQGSHWQTRRFITLTLAIAFNILCYVYLYWKGLSRFIQWQDDTLLTLPMVFQYSLANTFMLPSFLSVANSLGFYLQTSQQVISFIFLAIILSSSIPEYSKEK